MEGSSLGDGFILLGENTKDLENLSQYDVTRQGIEPAAFGIQIQRTAA
jgi:hypothetical protein